MIEIDLKHQQSKILFKKKKSSHLNHNIKAIFLIRQGEDPNAISKKNVNVLTLYKSYSYNLEVHHIKRLILYWQMSMNKIIGIILYTCLVIIF